MSANGMQEDDQHKELVTIDNTKLQLLGYAGGGTLLPSPLAAVVSTLTGATSLSVKVGTTVAGWGLSAAREATLTSLEVSRLGVETLLHTVRRDVSRRSNTELGRQEAEGLLERAVSALHFSISTVSFFAASGFYVSSASINSLSSLSIQGLATLNAILGSTESSRAVAAIITLIRDELNKPGPGGAEEPVGYGDLVVGTTAFALLQRWGRRTTELNFRESGGEETIWDSVIDDKGFRADVVGTRRDYINAEQLSNRHQAAIPATCLYTAEDEDIEALERGTLHDTGTVQFPSNGQTRLSDEEIRERIMSQLPEGARAVITSETITSKTIKVDIYGTETTHIEAPPGTVMIAERLNHAAGHQRHDNDGSPDQTVTFRTAFKRSSSVEIESGDRLVMTAPNESQKASVEEDVVMRDTPVFDLYSDNSAMDSPSDERPDPMNIDSRVAEEVHSSPGPVANQKKSRKPTSKVPDAPKTALTKLPQPKKEKWNSSSKSEKTGPFKKALKSLSPSQSSTAIKDIASFAARDTKRVQSTGSLASAIPRMTPAVTRDLKPLPKTPNGRSYGSLTNHGRTSPSFSRSMPNHNPNQTSFTVRERRRNSIVSQTDSWSVHSSRPGSPTFTRTSTYTSTGLGKTQSEIDMAVWGVVDDRSASDEARNHRRTHSFVPSLYSMATKDSEDPIILAPKTPIPRKSVFEDHDILRSLVSDGLVPGIFPKQHLVRTVRRFAKFASASYGSNFLRVMGLANPEKELSASTELMTLDVHHEHSSFSSHTGMPPDTILLSSFVDPQGMTGNTEWSPSAISPLAHFISIDHDSKAVVLTCRGTLGFEDVLTDMACDFDDLYWQGTPYKVHKGIHASAKRLLGANGSRVMATIRATMEEYPDFGLILCGHSLGGAVAALLAVLISEPSKDESSGASFVTAHRPRLLTNSPHDPTTTSYYVPPINLPEGRPIHVYAYGTPATVSPSLRLATRGLITTIVNHNDVVPSLSLGMLHDFKAVALNLKTDKTDAFNKLKTRVWQRLRHAVQSAFYVDPGPPPPENVAGTGIGEDSWAWAALKTLRAGMDHEKLVPPGEVFVVETSRVFDRQTFGPDAGGGGVDADTATERVFRSLGRPATRVQFKLIRDVEGRFGEIRFGRSMFSDHSPGRYEASLAALQRGVLEE